VLQKNSKTKKQYALELKSIFLKNIKKIKNKFATVISELSSKYFVEWCGE
jgi:hypothetical protein